MVGESLHQRSPCLGVARRVVATGERDRRETIDEHSTSGHKGLVREPYQTIYEGKSFDAVPEYDASDATRHGGLQGSIEGHEPLQGYLQAALGGFSDIEMNTDFHGYKRESGFYIKINSTYI